MKAYKCDRCGKFFDHLCRDVDKIFVTSTYKVNANVNIKELCADCRNELEAWWNIQKTEKEEKNESSRYDN